MRGVWNFSRRQVQWVLDNFPDLREGIWPDFEQAECYGRGTLVSARAAFESAAMLAAELGCRVKMCGLDGLLVEERYGMVTDVPKLEAVIARERHLDLYEVVSRILRVSWYCTSERGTDGARRRQSYEDWKRETRHHHRAVYPRGSENPFQHSLHK